MIAVANLADAVAVAPHPTETETPRARALARCWSAPAAVDGLGPDIPASLVFRAFEIDPQSKSFVLLRVHSTRPRLTPRMRRSRARWSPRQGPRSAMARAASYNSGVLGVQAYAGGSGEAERRYLETLEVVIKQQIAQSNWLFDRRRPRLHISYLSTADDVDHTWYRAGPGRDARYVEFRRWGYMALEHAVRVRRSRRAKEIVIFTSDRGMAPVTQLFAVDRVLADAGRRRRLHRQHLPAVEPTEWKGGTIGPDKREATLERVALLVAPRTPAGGPIVTKVYSTRAELAAFGHDGPGGADLCCDVARRIGPSSEWSLRGGTGILSGANPSRGMHGFDPARRHEGDLADSRAAGLPPVGPQPSAAVAPLVADLLGIDPPRDATARSPMR